MDTREPGLVELRNKLSMRMLAPDTLNPVVVRLREGGGQSSITSHQQHVDNSPRGNAGVCVSEVPPEVYVLHCVSQSDEPFT